MAVAKDAVMTGGNGDSGADQEASAATSVSSTGMTVGSSATLLVATLVLMNGGAASTGLAATWNGVSMTLRSNISYNPGQSCVVAIFTLVNPASGNHTLAASWTTASDAYLSCISFTGTDTTTGVKVSDDTTATASSIVINTDAAGATVGVGGSTNSGGATMNFVTIWSDGNLQGGGGANYQLGGSGTNTHTFAAGQQIAAGVHVIALSASGAIIYGWDEGESSFLRTMRRDSLQVIPR